MLNLSTRNTPIILAEGQRRLEVTHKGKDFTFYFPEDVRNITLILEGNNVVAACFYGIIYPAEPSLPESATMKIDWKRFLATTAFLFVVIAFLKSAFDMTFQMWQWWAVTLPCSIFANFAYVWITDKIGRVA